MAHPETEIEPVKEKPVVVPPAAERLTAQKGHYKTKPADSGQTVRKNRPHADSEKVSGKAIQEGNHWRVLGITLPDVPEIRYEGKPSRGVINIIPIGGQTHGYLANLGKKELAHLATLPEPERFQYVRDKIAGAIVRKSEREFEREGN